MDEETNMIIQKLSVNGFKSLMSEQPIELGRVNCFIGANGVGKSNILEALGVIGAAAKGVVDDESLLRRGVRAGVPKLYKSSFVSERTPAHIGISVTSSSAAEYRVSLLNPLESPDPAWSFKTEYLFDGSEEIIADGVRAKKKSEPNCGTRCFTSGRA
ncbi:AAA family ATPase [Vibrio cholerae]|uniref:AAA family ATPase n=1 Tax=Vibrio cholerae TaxID=666 RepID=UPI001CA61AC4|nr:AAA family ATPase [Vibrio cholerae]